jgi:regulator of protease activity HflC (stomatin/prohibitin superfamily)
MIWIAFLAGSAAVIIASVFLWWRRNVFVVLIYDYQKGLSYRQGRLIGVVNAGRYHVVHTYSSIVPVDMRKTHIFMPAQEIFTRDRIFIKVTLDGFYQVADVLRAHHLSDYSSREFYTMIQVALRNTISSLTLDEVLDRRKELGANLEETMRATAHELGLELSSIVIKDILVPASVRKAYAGLLEAQKEAQKKLEQARGEQAVLRNLANSSAMYDKNPMLLQARLIQALGTGANSIVFNGDHSMRIDPQTPPTKSK